MSAVQTAYMFPDMPPAVRKVREIRGLVLGPNSSIRRAFTAIRNSVEDASACLWQSRDWDKIHDAALSKAIVSTLRGIELARQAGAPMGRLESILSDLYTAQEFNAKDGDCVIRAWTTVKRVLGSLECAFSARRTTSSSARARKGGK